MDPTFKSMIRKLLVPGRQLWISDLVGSAVVKTEAPEQDVRLAIIEMIADGELFLESDWQVVLPTRTPEEDYR